MGIGVSHRRAIGSPGIANARLFRVSLRFVNDMVILKREKGLLSKAQGNHAEGKLAPLPLWLRDRLAQKGGRTLDEIAG